MWFDGKLFLATLSVLYCYEDDAVDLYLFEDELPMSFYRFSVADGVLWSIGAKDAMAFDGQSWTRID